MQKLRLSTLLPVTPEILLVLGCISMTMACSRPTAQFGYTGELKVPAEIRFDNRSENAQQFEWNFGDGNTSTDSLPVHVYKKSGTYTVALTAKMGKKLRTMEQTIQVDAPDKCLVEIETAYGNMLVWLYDSTPLHRDNFLKLAEEGYFDSLLFHRIINGFMIQGGDPNSKNAAKGQPLGSGGPGYTIPAEFVDTLIHVKGALAAARTGDQVNPEKRSSGSQFYIVHGQPVNAQQLDQIEARKGFHYSSAQRELYTQQGGVPFLDRDYTVFGLVIEGLEVIDKIAAAPKDARDRPLEDVRMKIRPIN